MEEWEVWVAELNTPETNVGKECITDLYLWAAVEDDAEDGTCDFCGAVSRCVTFENLLPVIDDVLNQFFVTLEESGAYRDNGEWSETQHTTDDVLEYEILPGAVDDQVLGPLIRFFDERIVADHGFVLRRDVLASLHDFDEGAWRNFIKKARSGDIAAATDDLLGQLEPDVLDLFRRVEEYAQLHGLFKTATPVLWRCRPGSLDDNFRTGNSIGSAPKEHAADGRLNARQQSVFYGSTSLRGAVIEVANHKGPHVDLWAGEFTPTKALYHLDVMEPPPWPSPFASGAADTFDAIKFLIRFAETLREPKPEELGRHYLPTQIFTAYLLATHETLRPDAIKYASSLDPQSENWVVYADNEHCADADSKGLSPDEIYLLLNPNTVTFVSARDYVEPEH